MEKKNPAKKNDTADVIITDMNNLGSGVGRINGVVTFVSGACTGDELTVKLIKVTSDYNVGKILKINKPSPYRIDPDCIASKRCGGCVYRSVTYEHELQLKKNRVVMSMKKAGLDIAVGDVLYTGELCGYRNKAQFPVGVVCNGSGAAKSKSTAIGFYAGKSHDIIPCVTKDGSCRLQPEIFGEIADFVRVFMNENKLMPYDELNGTGVVRHLYMRRSESSGEVMFCIVVSSPCELVYELCRVLQKRFSCIASVYVNINSDNTNVVLGREYRHLYGKVRLTDKLCSREFEISPQSFWQVNREGAELLYNKAGELGGFKPGERVLDLFCGIGTVGMSVCSPDVKLYGVEIVPEAVENARRNAVINGFHLAEFICCDAADPSEFQSVLRRISSEGLDAVILDPPRKGCSPELLSLISELSPSRIVYISCNPDTLARDIATLSPMYCCNEVTPVDMFPRTGHVECVCILRRSGGQCG